MQAYCIRKMAKEKRNSPLSLGPVEKIMEVITGQGLPGGWLKASQVPREADSGVACH
jgi:hypothetical protein